MLAAALGASFSGNMLAKKGGIGGADGVIRPGKGTNRVSQNIQNIQN